MKRPPEPLDPSQFTIVPHVAIVDEFVMTNEDGSFKAAINESWIDKNVAHMNEREAATGDLSPYVIGHTPDTPFNESGPEAPELIGYLRNWHKDDLFETGRKASFADVWIMKGEEERAKKFPRRSAEIYVDRYEIDPCSALGPTTPARDLGLLKLSRDSAGSIKLTRECPDQRLQMPEETKKAADASETGAAKTSDAKLDAILAALQSIADTLGKTAAPGATPAAAASPTAADGATAPEDELSDEELEKLLGGLEETPADNTDKKKDEEKVKEDCTPKPDEKLAAENAELKVKLARTQVEQRLTALFAEGYTKADPKDAELVSDLIAQPPAMQERTYNLLKLHRSGAVASSTGPAGWLEVATREAVAGKKFVTTKEDEAAVTKLAREKGVTFFQAARELGYSTAE